MKSDIHPDYRPVVFKDKLADFAVLSKSTIKTKETIKWEDGEEYPVYYVDISLSLIHISEPTRPY